VGTGNLKRLVYVEWSAMKATCNAIKMEEFEKFRIAGKMPLKTSSI